MLKKTKIICSAGVGRIENAVKEAICMAVREHSLVTFTFNNVEITVQGDSSYFNVMSAYWKAAQEESRIGPIFSE
ncbi:MAG: hypothetical protein WCT16_04850 [Candidatus Buchananbacteria bacterium]